MNPQKKFIQLLRELFQFESADLDFGIYRIMNHKRQIIEQWITEDLPKTIKEELGRGSLNEQQKASEEVAAAKEEVLRTLGEDAINAEGILENQYHSTPVGRKYLEAFANATNTHSSEVLETTIYNHLYTFFSRYWQDGDFISKRRYSRKERYAIPYNGEEVTLYWANQDQYYVKTGEYFTDYSWRAHNGVTINFKIQEADVEQNNVKGEKRFFLPVSDVTFWNEENHTLIIPFEYRPLKKDEVSTYGNRNQQNKINEATIQMIHKRFENNLEALEALKGEKYRDASGNSISNLEHHIRQYTARNSRDYFIHKDLRGFLLRELDFYLKNEVLNLDELEVVGKDLSDGWFQMMRLIKRIGSKIVDFLAQIEDFQKMLWEKKKFVTETFYVVTVGNIPETFYSEIAACDEQWKEWKNLLVNYEDATDLFTISTQNIDKRVGCLKACHTLPLDTRFFSQDFVDRLMASFGRLDEITDGLLVHSENWQALNFLKPKYQDQVDFVYLDPPYNTEEDRAKGRFLYKDGYSHSTWIAMMSSRIEIGRLFLSGTASFFCSIDENEIAALMYLMKDTFGSSNVLTPFKWKRNRKPPMLSSFMGTVIEFLLVALKDRTQAKGFSWGNATDCTRPVLNAGNTMSERILRIGTEAKCGDCIIPSGKYAAKTLYFELLDNAIIKDGRLEKDVRVVGPFRVNQDVLDKHVFITRNKSLRRYVGEEEKVSKIPLDLIDEDDCRNETGKESLDAIFGKKNVFTNPKPPKYISKIMQMADMRPLNSTYSMVLDYFAGSGTTGHAVIDLNREDCGQRKFILVEMGEYFDSVLLSRLERVTFTPGWEDGKPTRQATPEEADRSPRIVKVIRLESYEDALQNIDFDIETGQQALSLFKDEYLLHYMLSWETRKSETLLNVEKLQSPFSYKLRIYRDGETREQTVDLPETFSYLIGLTVQSRRAYFDEERRYLVYRGVTRENRKMVVIWRETLGWVKSNYERDATFVENQNMIEDADEILVNNDSYILGAHSLDPIFKEAMFKGVTG